MPSSASLSTLSLHDALPISLGRQIDLPLSKNTSVLLTVVGVTADVRHVGLAVPPRPEIFVNSMQSSLPWSWLVLAVRAHGDPDRKSTRLNSSHLGISYAVFCLPLHSFPTRRSSDLTRPPD